MIYTTCSDQSDCSISFSYSIRTDVHIRNSLVPRSPPQPPCTLPPPKKPQKTERSANGLGVSVQNTMLGILITAEPSVTSTEPHSNLST